MQMPGPSHVAGIPRLGQAPVREGLMQAASYLVAELVEG